MTGMEKVIGRCKSADAGSDYLMRGWGTDENHPHPILFSPSPLFTALNVLYRWCFKGAGKSTKTAKPACNSEKWCIVWMLSERKFGKSKTSKGGLENARNDYDWL